MSSLSNEEIIKDKDKYKVRQLGLHHFVLLAEEPKAKQDESKKQKVGPKPYSVKKKSTAFKSVHVKIDSPTVSFSKKGDMPKVDIRTSGLKMLEQEEEKQPKNTQITAANGMQLNTSSIMRQLGYIVTRSREYR